MQCVKINDSTNKNLRHHNVLTQTGHQGIDCEKNGAEINRLETCINDID